VGVDVSRINFPSNLSIGFAIIAGLGASFGSAFQAQAQIDPNAQSRVQSYTIPLSPGIADTQFGSTSATAPGAAVVLPPINGLNENNIGACLDDPSLVVVLFNYNRTHGYPSGYLKNEYPEVLKMSGASASKDPNEQLKAILGYLPHNKKLASEIIGNFFDIERQTGRQIAVKAVRYYIDPKSEPPPHEVPGINLKPYFISPFSVSITVVFPARF
jgi:hypothetical protein